MVYTTYSAGSPSTRLGNILDVEEDSLSNNHVLSYNAALKKWRNAIIPTQAAETLAITLAGGNSAGGRGITNLGSVTLNNGATIVNTSSNLLTITEANTQFTGNVQITGSNVFKVPIELRWAERAGVNDQLGEMQSGTTILVDGTNNNVINLPPTSGTQPGTTFKVIFIANQAARTGTMVAIGNANSNFHGVIHLTGAANVNATTHDIRGHRFTFIEGTSTSSYAEFVCLADDGRGTAIWHVNAVVNALATIG
jgi:hypothetical protein